MSATVLFDINGNPLTTLSDGSLLVTLANDGYSNIVSISNFPAFPAVQPVSQSGVFSVAVNNFPATQPISGSISITGTPTVDVGNFPATQAVSGTVAISNFPAQYNKGATSTVTAVASSVTVVTLLAANANRIFAHISNALPNKTLYIKLGTAASETSFTDLILLGDSYDVPSDYTGVVTGIWATGVNAANALITEISP
jgi:hypothetical protein